MRLILVTVILTLISGNTEAAAAAPADAPQTGQPNLAFVTGGNPDGHRSWLALELSPLGPFVGHFGGAIELVPMPHHALVLAGYYMPPFGQAIPYTARTRKGSQSLMRPPSQGSAVRSATVTILGLLALTACSSAPRFCLAATELRSNERTTRWASPIWVVRLI